MEYTLIIWCEECTKFLRETNKYHPPYTFESLTDAIQHVSIGKVHTVKIDLEPVHESPWK